MSGSYMLLPYSTALQVWAVPDFPFGPLGHGPGAALNSRKTQKRGGGTQQENLRYYTIFLVKMTNISFDL